MKDDARAAALPHLPSLDGLRTLAVVLTSLVHLEPDLVPGGFIGVDVFFVLSGFLITSILLREHALTGRLDLRRFYARRTRRLLPAVLALMAVFGLVTVLLTPTVRDLLVAAVTFGGVMTYTMNWAAVVGHDVPWQVDHLWSLSVDEQFYLLWPLVLIFLLPRVRRRTLLSLTLAGVALSTVAQAVVFDGTRSVSIAYEASPLHAQGILVGCAVAQVLARRAEAAVAFEWFGHRTWTTWLGLAALGAMAVGLDLDRLPAYNGGILLASVAAAVVMVGLVSQDMAGRDSAVRRWFSSAPMVALGKRSYSIYLWQNFMAWALTPLLRDSLLWVPANVVATLVAAELSYRFIERRWTSPRPPRASRTSRRQPTHRATDALR